MLARVERFFYKRLQYAGSVDQSKRNRQQPVPRSRDILAKGKPDEYLSRYLPPDPHKQEGARPAPKEP